MRGALLVLFVSGTALAQPFEDSTCMTGSIACSSRGLVETGDQPAVAAANAGSIAAIVADEAGVYWTDAEGRIVSLEGAVAHDAAGPQGIALDHDWVYWANAQTGTIQRVSRRGGAPSVLARDVGAPSAIAIDAVRVYFTDPVGERIAAVPLGGGAVTVLATHQQRPQGITVAGACVCWTTFGEDDGAVACFEPRNAVVRTLAHIPEAPALVYASGSLYVASIKLGQILRVPLAGGGPTPVETRVPVNGTVLATDGGNLYFQALGGGIARAPLGGGPATIMTSTIHAAAGLAVTSTDVYVGEDHDCGASFRSVYRVAKDHAACALPRP
jgi:sugar lactone lactonase YvrE